MKAIGISLGNHSVKAAFLRDGVVTMLPSEDGGFLTPSVVWQSPQGHLVVGSAARSAMATDPANAIDGFVHALGHQARFVFARTGQVMTPEELTAAVLAKIRHDAEKTIGEPVDGAVITVPGDAGVSKCAAIKHSASLAGFEQCSLLAEPVAAAMDSKQATDKSARFVLVYDAGATSTCVSLLQIKDESLQILAHAGDPCLAGAAIDREIVASIFMPALHNAHPDVNTACGGSWWNQSLAELRIEAEDVKARLSSRRDTTAQLLSLRLNNQGPRAHFECVVTRDQLDGIAAGPVKHTIDLLKRVLADQHLTPSDVSQLIPVGGTTLLPRVHQQLAELGIPLASGDPLSAAARGAAMLAAAAIMSEGVSTPKQRRIDQNVQFTVYRPQIIPPNIWHPLLAFAHLSARRPDASPNEAEPLEEVRRQASQALGQQLQNYQPMTQDSNAGIPQESEITFFPEIPGIEFNPSRAAFLWLESVHRQDFRMRAQVELDGKTARGRLTVFLGVRLIADVPLAIRVDSQAAQCIPAPVPEAVTASPYRKVFASYSHQDLPIVVQYEDLCRSLGDDYLRDHVTLRSGEIWSERLAGMIREADIFQLFWSRNSMRSKFVHQEWDHALSLNRRNFVRPVYWETPLPEDKEAGLPPEKLRQLQFHLIGSGVTQSPLFPKVETVRGKGASPMSDAPPPKGSAHHKLRDAAAESTSASMDVKTQFDVPRQLGDAAAESPAPTGARPRHSWLELAAIFVPIGVLSLFVLSYYGQEIKSGFSKSSNAMSGTDATATGVENISAITNGMKNFNSGTTPFGGTSPSLLGGSRNESGNVLLVQGQYAKAETEYREVIKLEEKLLGPEHSDTLATRNNMASALFYQGKYAKAETEFREVIKLEEKVAGPTSPVTLQVCYNLAVCLKAEKNLDEAEVFGQRAAQLWNSRNQ
jgi:actin-like ATPase involved in cell morphogenesis